MTDRKAKSFEDIIQFFSEFDRYQGWVFRGQEDASWRLIPSICRGRLVKEKLTRLAEMRKDLEGTISILDEEFEAARKAYGSLELANLDETKRQFSEDKTLVDGHLEQCRQMIFAIERSVLSAMRKNFRRFLDKEEKSDWELLALGQHFGVATRLLDWTRNPLVACFFALQGEPSSGSHGGSAVYAIKVLDVLATSIRPEQVDRVFLYDPPYFHERLSDQSSVFSVAPPLWQVVDEGEQAGLHRIVIPRECRNQILRTVVSLGVNFASIFSDLRGAALDVSWEVERSDVFMLKQFDFAEQDLSYLEGLQRRLKAIAEPIGRVREALRKRDIGS